MPALKLMSILLCCTVAMCAMPALAQDQDVLEVGEMSPAVPDGEWIGDKPDLGGEQIRLVFFWEPTMAESRLALPILSQLQERWGTDRLQIIGVGVEELKTDQKPYVKPWVIRHSTRIKFPVVIAQRGKLNRAFRKSRQPPYFFMVVTTPDNRVQAMVNPLSSDLNDLIAKLVGGRYDVAALRQGEPYMEQLEQYRERRDWAQYALMVQRLNGINAKVFADVELDYIVSLLTEQDDAAAALVRINENISSRSGSDPDYLGMLAECLATDPRIPDAIRPLDAAHQAATESLNAAVTAESKARAMARMAEVLYKQGHHEQAVMQARQAYRVAPRNMKTDYRERWVTIKRRAAADISSAGA